MSNTIFLKDIADSSISFPILSVNSWPGESEVSPVAPLVTRTFFCFLCDVFLVKLCFVRSMRIAHRKSTNLGTAQYKQIVQLNKSAKQEAEDWHSKTLIDLHLIYTLIGALENLKDGAVNKSIVEISWNKCRVSDGLNTVCSVLKIAAYKAPKAPISFSKSEPIHQLKWKYLIKPTRENKRWPS